MKKLIDNDSVVILTGIAIGVMTLIAVCAIVGIYERETREAMDKAAATKAFCDSVGGQYGGEKCYKDGKEMVNEN